MVNESKIQQYKQNSLESMTKSELLLVLYDELVKRLLRCDLAFGKQDWPLFEASAQRCIDILNYLDDTLDLQYPVGQNLHKMYGFFLYELQRIKIGRNKEQLDIIRPMIADLRDTFRKASENFV